MSACFSLPLLLLFLLLLPALLETDAPLLINISINHSAEANKQAVGVAKQAAAITLCFTVKRTLSLVCVRVCVRFSNGNV